MKDKKLIIGIVSAVVTLAAIITAVLVFRQELCQIVSSIKEKTGTGRKDFTPEEFEDFADI